MYFKISSFYVQCGSKYSCSSKNDADDFNIDGIMVQLPLPEGWDERDLIETIPPYKDVDGLTYANMGMLHEKEAFHEPCTAKGIIWLLHENGIHLTGKHVVVVGRSEIVGKPLAKLMTDANATVSLCHSYSKLEPLLEIADLVVCAVGQPHFLDCSKLNCPVIDVGINFDENGKLVGDCYNIEGKDVTPVPGGVGLLTRCALLDNVIKAAKGGQGLCQ